MVLFCVYRENRCWSLNVSLRHVCAVYNSEFLDHFVPGQIGRELGVFLLVCLKINWGLSVGQFNGLPSPALVSFGV